MQRYNVDEDGASTGTTATARSSGSVAAPDGNAAVGLCTLESI